MSTFINETEADQTVIGNLLKELKRRHPMSKVVVAQDGTIYELHQYEVLTPEDVQARANKLKEEAAELEATVAPAPAAEPQPEQAPVEQPAPAEAPQQEQPATEPVPAPAEVVTPEQAPAPVAEPSGDQTNGQTAPENPPVVLQ